ncbi:MAG: EVE domain-containing protein [Chlamydiae bacterium]|nr:EVE domain-containing protein [Chlamydiota bacterium]MBI3278053.1 EVE domain-containing protein [Chlamydiota bacterium]
MKEPLHYWLMKSEPDVYSIDDLKKDKRTYWHGVRNYQARNFMRDTMQIGDLVLFYHSNAEPAGVAGLAKVVKKGTPDLSALDPKSEYFDPKATKENPIWYRVDIEFLEKFSHFIPLPEIKANKALSDMRVVQRFARLSIQPVEEKHFEKILEMGRQKN